MTGLHYTTSRWALAQALMSQHGTLELIMCDGNDRLGLVVVRLSSVEREDGSGRSFNVRAWRGKDSQLSTFYVRTTD